MPMSTPARAPRGSLKDAVGIYAQLPKELFDAYVQASAERGITRRLLVEAAIRRELAEPTVFADPEYQEELPLKTA